MCGVGVLGCVEVGVGCLGACVGACTGVCWGVCWVCVVGCVRACVAWGWGPWVRESIARRFIIRIPW